MPTLNVEEYQYGDDGVPINGSANGLPFVDVTSIEGLDSAPVRDQSHDRDGIDGGYVDAEFETIRTINIEGLVYTIPTQTEIYLDSLKSNFAPTRTPKPFYLQTDAGQRVIWGKSLGFNYAKDQQRRLGIVEFQVQILCEDPRIYDPYPVTTETQLAQVITSGRSYPKTYPVLYGASASTNNATLVLGGNRTTPGVLRIDGPVINPSIVYDNTGTTMAFKTSIPQGSYIEINLDNRSVLLNGTAPRRNVMTLSGGWFLLEPGVNSFRFFGTDAVVVGGHDAPKLTVTAYAAYR